MKKTAARTPVILFVMFLAICGSKAQSPEPTLSSAAYIGEWALYPSDGGAGWLSVNSSSNGLKAEMMWRWGSVLPLNSVRFEGGQILMTRLHEGEKKSADGTVRKFKTEERIILALKGDVLRGMGILPKPQGEGEDRYEFRGERLPSMPPAPDMGALRFGDAIPLLNGKDLAGWRLDNTNSFNGWACRDGILVNEVVNEEGKPHKNYGNLRTDREFEDFDLHSEVRVPKGGNSGIYIRGIYEVQVYDTYGKPLDPHNMGAVYSRICPTVSAEKPAGEWQTLDITFVKRHVTIKLNGTMIINNQPIQGPTGGALWPDVNRPGPILLQGDHTSIEYRNLILRPVIEEN